MVREIIIKKDEYGEKEQLEILKKCINFHDGLERNEAYKTVFQNCCYKMLEIFANIMMVNEHTFKENKNMKLHTKLKT